LPVVLSALVFATPSLAKDDHAPLPEKLVTAKTVYLINDSGDLKVYDKFYSALKAWNRFAIVTSRATADVVMVLTSSSQYALSVASGTAVSGGGVTSGVGTSVAVPSTLLHLKVFDSSTADLLWSDATEKWVTAGHAPSKLISNMRKRMPKAAVPSK
jgi:hypothetical protein